MLRQWLSFRTLSIALAIVLIVTAVLKLHLLLTDPFADIKTGTSLPLLWLAVFAEAGVVWIVFSKAPEQLKWLSVISLFGIMAVVSAYNVLVGKTSCGCAGTIEISPIWQLVFDVTSLILLVLDLRGENSVDQTCSSVRFSPNNFGYFVGTTAIALTFVVFQTSTLRSTVLALALGRSVAAIPIHLGHQKVNEVIHCDLKLINHSSERRKILGVGNSCECVVVQDVCYKSIPEFGQLNVNLVVKPKKAGDFHQRVLFYLDSRRQFVVSAELFGQIYEE